MHRDGQPPPNQQQKANDQHQVAHQAELLGKGGKDEIGRALGNELQVRLRAGHESLAKGPARTNGNHALDDVKSLAQRVTRRIEQRADALLLVVVQHRPAYTLGTDLGLKTHDQHDPYGDQQHGGQHQLPGQTSEENHRKPSRQHQQRGPQIGLLHDEPHRHRQQQAGYREIQCAQLAFALLEPPSQHQGHADLQELARLNHHPQVDPALRPFLGNTGDRYRHQQQHPHRVQGGRKRHQPLRWNLCHGKQQHQRDDHVARMVDKARAVVVARGVHGQQAGPGQYQHQHHEPAVETAKQRQDARGQRGLVDRGFHGPRLSRATMAPWFLHIHPAPPTCSICTASGLRPSRPRPA